MDEHAPNSRTPVLLVPGWRNSGPGHWQQLWAQRVPGARMVEQADWLNPRRADWVAALARQVLAHPQPVVIAAHSLGCIATAHLPPEAAARIAGALLVAPADPERRGALVDFAPVPCETLPYPSILVASSNDPFCPPRRAGSYARAWGSDFLRLPAAGHINVDSGHGDWPLGLALLETLRAGAGADALPAGRLCGEDAAPEPAASSRKARGARAVAA